MVGLPRRIICIQMYGNSPKKVNHKQEVPITVESLMGIGHESLRRRHNVQLRIGVDTQSLGSEFI